MSKVHSHGKRVRKWTHEDKVFLLNNAPTMSIQEMGKQLGRSYAAMVAQCARQQISYFSDKED